MDVSNGNYDDGLYQLVAPLDDRNAGVMALLIHIIHM